VELGEGLAKAILGKSKDFKEYCLLHQVTGFEEACLRRHNQTTPNPQHVPPVRAARSATLTGRTTETIEEEPETEPSKVAEEGVKRLIHTGATKTEKSVQAIQIAKSAASPSSVPSEEGSKDPLPKKQS
jgi:hypothetical protein